MKEITEGRLADVVLDVTPGATKPIEMALDLARIGATIVIAGFKHFQPMTGFLSDKMFFKELTLKGVWGRDPRSVEVALRLIESNKYPLHKLCTHTYSVGETEQALRTVAGEGDKNAVHVSITPDHV